MRNKIRIRKVYLMYLNHMGCGWSWVSSTNDRNYYLYIRGFFSLKLLKLINEHNVFLYAIFYSLLSQSWDRMQPPLKVHLPHWSRLKHIYNPLEVCAMYLIDVPSPIFLLVGIPSIIKPLSLNHWLVISLFFFNFYNSHNLLSSLKSFFNC